LASYLDNSLQTIRTSSSSFMVSSSPIQSTSAPPTFAPTPISPYSQKKARYSVLLSEPPSNVREEELQNSVRELLVASKHHTSQIVNMQSSLVLNGAYCDLVRGQLAAQEDSKKSKKKGRLVGDGMPRLLTSNEFVRRVVAFQKTAEDTAVESEKRRVTKAERKEAMTGWRRLEKIRKDENQAIRARWQESVTAWEVERDRAKLAGRRPAWKKPVLTGQLLSPVPKPPLVADEGEEPAAGPSNGGARGNSSGSEDSENSEGSEDDED
jgi:hypothetical protein